MTEEQPVQAPGAASRRDFLEAAAVTTVAAGALGFPAILEGAEPLSLPPLPWPDTALDPVISAKTLSFHWGKHHKGYVDALNGLIKGTPLEGKSLEEIVRASASASSSDAAMRPVFNNAAQAWNHDFYWKSLRPKGGAAPGGLLAERIAASFGSLDALKKELVGAGMGQFGSGWAWLVAEGTSLKVVKTANADTPVTTGATPLLVLDVWEHAYYLDYQNRRKDYLSAVVDGLLNWDFAASNLPKKP
jgi:Fe-Mn family superoxide dismutase